MTVGKRENEKKRIAKREEKLKKKENKKLHLFYAFNHCRK